MIAINRRRYMGGGGGIPASSYIQSGLIALYDGIENAGAGSHSASATTWVDLVSGKNLSLIQGSANWGDSYFQFGTNRVFTADASQWDSALTIEVVCDVKPDGHLLQYKSDKVFTMSNSEYITLTTGNVTMQGATLQSTNLSSFSANYTNKTVHQNNSLLSNSSRYSRSIVSETDNLILGMRYYSGYRQATNIALYCLRLYNRELSAEEIAANYAIDQQRFGLT